MKRGGGRGVRKNPFDWGGMDIFWTYTFNPHWEFKAKMTKEKLKRILVVVVKL